MYTGKIQLARTYTHKELEGEQPRVYLRCQLARRHPLCETRRDATRFSGADIRQMEAIPSAPSCRKRKNINNAPITMAVCCQQLTSCRPILPS